MGRWDELERLGKLRADGLLSEEEFETQKRRLLDSDETAAEPTAETSLESTLDVKGGGWIKYVLAGGTLALVLLLICLISPSSNPDGSSTDAVVENIATADADAPSGAKTLALRSNVAGASLVRLKQLPATTPYGDNSDGYCGERRRPSTPGGQIAENRGWRVVNEAKFHGLDAVLIVRGYDPGTSGHCFSKDPNLAFFDSDRLVGLLFSKGEKGIGMNNIEIVGEHLRVWDDMSPVGRVALVDDDLTFDHVTGSDEVCDGKYRVPAVFGQPWSKARRLLGSSGWIAKPSTKETFEGDRTRDYRTRFPEVDACSGTGYAYCSFGLAAKDGIARLNVTTAGEDEDPVMVRYDVSCDGSGQEPHRRTSAGA